MAAQEDVRRQAGVSDENARAVWNETTDAARSVASQQQKAAAQGLDKFAGALRDAARHADDGGGTTSRVAHGIADGLDRVSRQLKSRDLDSLIREVEDFARSQPLVFFGAAVASGFIALRFLRSATPDAQRERARPGSDTLTTGMSAAASDRTTGARGDTARAGDGAPNVWPELDPLDREPRAPGLQPRPER